MPDASSIFEQMFGTDPFKKTAADEYVGKRVDAHGKEWILIHRVTPKLFLAVESGTRPPCDVKLIRL